jgi:hypothetical protein
MHTLQPACTSKIINRTLDGNSKISFLDNYLPRNYDDRRFQRIAMTKEGRTLVPRLAQIADENEIFYFSHLSKAEKKML